MTKHYLLETNDIDAVVSLTNAPHGRWFLTRQYVPRARHKWLLCEDFSDTGPPYPHGPHL
jgi:hypothetical protein